MKLHEENNLVILEDTQNFDARAIFTCGQAFRWYEEKDGSFTTVHLGRVLNVLNEDNRVVFKGTNLEEFKEIWVDYFDLNTNYKEIRKTLSGNEILVNAMEYGKGIRILNQNHFEMLISFIISANNMIPRIKKSIEVISMRYGKFICEDEIKKYKEYLSLQCDSALRNVVRIYPYDVSSNIDTTGDGIADDGSLRGSSEIVAQRIKEEIQEKVQEAGLEIVDARITYLAYAPEIASVMLQRQQAAAIIDARKMIVDGAVGMVEMALDRLKENNVVDLDDERKAQMVSNLLVVLCGNKDAQPIVNSGSLY